LKQYVRSHLGNNSEKRSSRNRILPSLYTRRRLTTRLLIIDYILSSRLLESHNTDNYNAANFCCTLVTKRIAQKQTFQLEQCILLVSPTFRETAEDCVRGTNYHDIVR